MGAGEIVAGGVQGTIQPVLGYIQSQQARNDQKNLEKRRREALEKAGREADFTYSEIESMIRDADRNRYAWSTPEQKELYQQMVNEYGPDVYNFEEFNYRKTAEDFLNPEAQKIAELAGLQKDAELASKGASRGSMAQGLVGYSKWKAAEDLWKDAQDQMYKDRGQAYQEYGDYIDRTQRKLDIMNKEQIQKMNILAGNIGKDEQAQSDMLSDLISVMGDKATSKINLGIAGASA